MRAKLVNEAVKHLSPKSSSEISDSFKDLANGQLWMKWLTCDTYEERRMYYCELQKRAYSGSDEAWRYKNAIEQQAQEWYMKNQKDLDAYYKKVYESIKHLSPKSKEELDAMSKKIHDEFETRKEAITKLINKLGKKFNRTPKFTTYPIFNPFDPFKKIIDFGGEIEYSNHFMFYVRTQEHLNGFELGCGTIKHQGNPFYDEWEEVDNIKDVEDRIYVWYNEYVTKY